jgi:hypothetical protein
MPHDLMPHHLSPLTNNSKNFRNDLMSRHISPLKNNSKNSGSMPLHLSILKNNSKNLGKSSHTTSPLSIDK